MDSGFLVRVNYATGQQEVWTGRGWAGVPPEPTDGQCEAVGGIWLSVKESERVSSQDAGENITMIPVSDQN